MIETFQQLERQTLIAPLGVRFWDVAFGAYVRGGLTVSAYPAGDPSGATDAMPNRSGTYVLHHAKGLREFEMGLSKVEFTETTPERWRFTVEVRDLERRFVPVAFEAWLPFKGFFRWQATTLERTPLDPPDELSIPLYSSIQRGAPAGMAVLRLELYEASASETESETDEERSRKPAAWAMLEARSGGRLLGRGLADEQGRMMLVFAYPSPQNTSNPVGSAPGSFSAGLPFLKQEWTIELQAYYGPDALLSPPSPPSPPGSPPSSVVAGSQLPDLSRLLDQPPADLFLDEAQMETVTEVSLMYGPNFFVHPSGSNAGSPLNPIPLSILFITPADSPPS
ncbi:MAG TPA: hypothetical protein VGB17_06740 [Pyrinomonadaceae bacterium]|jgi:hypothetical protein